MKIACWNVNSIRVRLPHLLVWLQEHNPEVMLLQELKCQAEHFPSAEIEDLGYNIAFSCQKGGNGVAILSKSPLEDVALHLPSFPEDQEARYIEAVVGKFRVASVYVPNGQSLESEKYLYKMTFLSHLYEHLESLMNFEEAVIIGGDFNIAPADEDVHDPVIWHEQILCSSRERQQFRRLLNLGYHDAIRMKHTGVGPFTWWNYQKASWQKGEGLRIDHLLLSPQAADLLKIGDVDQGVRGLEKSSDHAIVWGEFSEPYPND